MMATKQETAEQKLLKMIEATSKSGDESAPARQKITKKKDLLSNIRIVNKILLLCILSALIFAGVEIKDAMSTNNSDIKVSVKKIVSRNISTPTESIVRPKELALYMVNIKRRNLFSPYKKKIARNTSNASANNSPISAITSKYRLVGISWLDNIASASVMLEDTEKKVTYFLQKGEKIGDIVVKTIYADSVELGYKSEEIIIEYDKSQM